MNQGKTVLSALQAAIANYDLNTRLLEPTSAIPVFQLQAALDITLNEQPLHCEIILLPDLPEPPVLQIFIPLPFQIERDRISHVARFLMMLNNVLPLHGFGMMESSQEVYFRLLLPFQLEAFNPELAVDALFVISASLEMFGDLICRLAAKKANFDDVVNDLQTILSDLEIKDKGRGTDAL